MESNYILNLKPVNNHLWNYIKNQKPLLGKPKTKKTYFSNTKSNLNKFPSKINCLCHSPPKTTLTIDYIIKRKCFPSMKKLYLPSNNLFNYFTGHSISQSSFPMIKDSPSKTSIWDSHKKIEENFISTLTSNERNYLMSNFNTKFGNHRCTKNHIKC